MAHRQINQVVSVYLLSVMMLLTLLPPAHVVSMACNACGPECANACGTAMFRACCFNYNRKRSAPANLSEGGGSAEDRWIHLFGKAVDVRDRRPSYGGGFGY